MTRTDVKPVAFFPDVQIHFIYACFLEPIDPTGFHDRLLASLPVSYAADTVELFPDGPKVEDFSYPGQKDGASIRDYLQPYVCFPMPQVWGLLYKSSRLTLEIPGDKSGHTLIAVSIALHLRVLASGRGVLRYILNISSPDRPMSPDRIVDICNLGLRRRPNGHDAADQRDPACRSRLVHTDSGDEVFLRERFRKDISFLHDTAKTTGHGESRLATRPTEPFEQDPYPVVLAAPFADLYEEGSKGRAFHRDLLTILFRSREFGKPDLTFAEEHLGVECDRLPNLCSTTRAFMQVYLRSSMVLLKELRIDALTWQPTGNPGSYIIPAFLFTIECLRMRWYAASVLNYKLECALRQMSVVEVTRGLLGERVRGVAALRSLVGMSLSDPITYEVGSGSLTKVYAVGVHSFRVEEMERVVVERMNLLDRLLQDRLYITATDERKRPFDRIGE